MAAPPVLARTSTSVATRPGSRKNCSVSIVRLSPAASASSTDSGARGSAGTSSSPSGTSSRTFASTSSSTCETSNRPAVRASVTVSTRRAKPRAPVDGRDGRRVSTAGTSR